MRHILSTFWVILICLILFMNAQILRGEADTIYLNNGDSVEGTIVERNEDLIKVENIKKLFNNSTALKIIKVTKTIVKFKTLNAFSIK